MLRRHSANASYTPAHARRALPHMREGAPRQTRAPAGAPRHTFFALSSMIMQAREHQDTGEGMNTRYTSTRLPQQGPFHTDFTHGTPTPHKHKPVEERFEESPATYRALQFSKSLLLVPCLQ